MIKSKSKPKFVYSSDSKKLYRLKDADYDSSSSEEEIVKKKAPLKKQSKKIFEDSSSEEEETPKKAVRYADLVESEEESEESESEEEITPPKVSKKKKTPVKSSKKRPAPDESEEESEVESDVEVKQKLKKAAAEILTEEEMKARTQSEHKKKYMKAKKYIAWYEKEYKSDTKKVDLWKKASQLMTSAAASKSKYNGLIRSTKINEGTPLRSAIEGIRTSGEKAFNEAMAIVANLSPEDQTKFWKEQQRNVGVTSYDDLKTIKEWDEEKLRNKILEEQKRQKLDHDAMEEANA